jgi:hypothetical protein
LQQGSCTSRQHHCPHPTSLFSGPCTRKASSTLSDTKNPPTPQQLCGFNNSIPLSRTCRKRRTYHAGLRVISPRRDRSKTSGHWTWPRSLPRLSDCFGNKPKNVTRGLLAHLPHICDLPAAGPRTNMSLTQTNWSITYELGQSAAGGNVT